jgi:menaquinol-cytochrome c reductase iron-sulfur subunit
MDDDEPKPPDRRGFLKVATCALGGGVGLVTVAPVLRLVLAPREMVTVSTPSDPLDAGDPERFRVGDPPQRVDLIAPVVKDAWTAARDVVLGSAWIRRARADQLVALSAVCPHLGCAVSWDAAAGNYLCPCHDSRFAVEGERLTGPAERGLDPLPLSIKDGRLQLVWVRYKMGSTTREPA